MSVAIIEIGSKQYKVSVGDVIYVEKLELPVDSSYTAEKVLLKDNEVGTPYLSNAKVIFNVEKHGKQPKILIIKHRSQKHHTKRAGHRQPYTKLLVKEII